MTPQQGPSNLGSDQALNPGPMVVNRGQPLKYKIRHFALCL